MDDDVEPKDQSKAPFTKDWKFWIGVIGLLCSIVTTYLAVDSRADAKNEAAARVQAEETAKIARMAAKRAEEHVKQLEAEEDSMRKFLINYSAHLTKIRNALSRLKEVPTAESEKELWATVDAFITFVGRWRRVQPILADLLDGIVDRLAAAALTKDKDSADGLSLQLEKELSDQRLLLEKEIENLKRAAP